MNRATTTLVLGGGFGGLVTAVELRERLGADHRIVVIDQSDRFVVGAAKTWVLLGTKRPEQVVHDRTGLVARGIEFVKAEVRSIDGANRRVVTGAGEFTGDALVVALGADVAMGAVPGLEEAAVSFYTLDQVHAMRPTLEAFRGGTVLLVIPSLPFKCPPAPYEAAMLLQEHFKRRGVEASFHLYTVEGAPMGAAGPEMGRYVVEEIERRGVRYHPNQKLARVDPTSRSVEFESGTRAQYDLLIAVPPHVPPPAVKASDLAAPSGWIPADPLTNRVSGFDHVYAIGDCAAVPLPGRFKPDVPMSLPKAGVLAAGQGRVVAAHIAAAAKGEKATLAFDGRGFCFIEMGDLHAVRGAMEFYAVPHPKAERRVPDMIQFEEKQAWVEEFVTRYVAPPPRPH